MKIKKSLIRFLFIALTLVLSQNCIAQITDSIKYDNGFLHYYEYGSKNLPAVIILKVELEIPKH